MCARPIYEGVRSQYGATFRMLREAIERVGEEEWLKGGPTWTDVPACAAVHTLRCAEFYVTADRKGFEWERNGWKSWEYPPRGMPGREETLGYLEEVKGKTWAFLEGLGEEDFLKRAEGKEHRYTVLEHLMYAIRHMQHHAGQISHESKKRGKGAAEWWEVGE